VRKSLLVALVTSGAALPTGCKSQPQRHGPGPVGSALPETSANAAAPSLFIRWRPGELPLEQFIQREVERAEADSARVLVYVGAAWCEPCKHFHEAVERRELDEAVAGIRFLEFDADRDGPELSKAGYRSQYIPLFAIPDPDGRSSGRMIEGSVKGPQAVRENLLPRLQKLLTGS
jgi:hypothetical protein